MNALKNNKGFSLIELMVVVAIIAILSTIAIPSYQSFQARARQKEGFALLSGYYTAAHSTRAEFNFYPGNLVSTGFAPTGTLTYRITAAQNQNLPRGSNDAACVDTAQACDCGTACPQYKGWIDAGGGAAGTIGPDDPATCAAAVNTNDFIVCATGWISTTAALADEYSMNQQKALVMAADGIN